MAQAIGGVPDVTGATIISGDTGPEMPVPVVEGHFTSAQL